jgi:hypothetical protein
MSPHRTESKHMPRSLTSVATVTLSAGGTCTKVDGRVGMEIHMH